MFNTPTSEHYKKYLALHRAAHYEGVERRYDGKKDFRPADRIFEGSEILHVMTAIKEAIDTLGVRHSLDYGCGKAKAYQFPFKVGDRAYQNFYEYTGLDPACVHLYDPCLNQYAQPPRPEQSFDLTICTDVMEHIPEQDVDAVLDYLWAKTRKALVFTIACHSSLTYLRGGLNAHVCVKQPEWWIEKIADRQKKKPLWVHADLSIRHQNGKHEVVTHKARP